MKLTLRLLLLLAMAAALVSCRQTPEEPTDTTPASVETDRTPATPSTDGPDPGTVTPETAAPVTAPLETVPSETLTPETDPPETAAPMPVYRDDEYEYRIDITPYLSVICPKDEEEYLVLANREHPIGPEYAPTDLVKMKANKSRYLRETASRAYDAMLAEMKLLGVADSYPQSTYRDYELQKALYQKYLGQEKKRHPSYSEEQLMELVDAYSARPGTSDHQTGLAIDFYPISTKFEKTAMYRYLLDNAYKFGFILRFPKGKTDVTGYMFESWHWRFVGRNAATYIHDHAITLEEYLAIRYGTLSAPLAAAPSAVAPDTADPETDSPEAAVTEAAPAAPETLPEAVPETAAETAASEASTETAPETEAGVPGSGIEDPETAPETFVPETASETEAGSDHETLPPETASPETAPDAEP